MNFFLNKKVNKKNILPWLLFSFIFFYNFHKYIFKYGDSNSSPTYSDTPFFWKFAKYIFFILLSFYIFLKTKRSGKISIYNLYFIYFIFFNFLILLLFFIGYGEFISDEFEYIIWSIIYFILIIVDLEFVENLVFFFKKKIKVFIVILLLGNLIVVFNFIYFGRLPAVAFSGSLIRFGGLWDDPNGFGFLCSVFVALAIQRKWRFLLLCLILSIILTFSFSAYIDLLFVLFLLTFKGFKTINYKLFIWGASLMVCLIIFLIIFREQLLNLYNMKQKSVGQHMDFTKSPFNLYNVLTSSYTQYETWLLGYLKNYTPISIIGLFFILFFWIKKIFSNNRSFFCIYVVTFIFGNLFIPLMVIFPVNLLFFIFLAFSELENRKSAKMDHVREN